MLDEAAVREMLARLLSWDDAHAGFGAAIKDLPAKLRGTQPAGLPYSPWQMLEHLRIAQHDILDFCINPGYKEMEWPKDYWPTAAAPPSDAAWNESIDGYLKDREALKELAADTKLV